MQASRLGSFSKGQNARRWAACCSGQGKLSWFLKAGSFLLPLPTPTPAECSFLSRAGDPLYWIVRPPATLKTDKRGLKLQVSRAKMNRWKGLFHYAPRHQGTTQRTGFRLTMVGRLVTVPGQQAGRQSPLCLCLSGWAL